MKNLWKCCVFLIAALALGCSQASAEKRVALVIGNGAYEHKAELANPKNDAEDVAAALKRTEFEVILATNVDQAEMQDADNPIRARREQMLTSPCSTTAATPCNQRRQLSDAGRRKTGR